MFKSHFFSFLICWPFFIFKKNKIYFLIWNVFTHLSLTFETNRHMRTFWLYIIFVFFVALLIALFLKRKRILWIYKTIKKLNVFCFLIYFPKHWINLPRFSSKQISWLFYSFFPKKKDSHSFYTPLFKINAFYKILQRFNVCLTFWYNF